MSNFYIVQRNGVPAIWQVDPEGIVTLLKRKSKIGYSAVSNVPATSRAEALAKLRELFPNSRPGGGRSGALSARQILLIAQWARVIRASINSWTNATPQW